MVTQPSATDGAAFTTFVLPVAGSGVRPDVPDVSRAAVVATHTRVTQCVHVVLPLTDNDAVTTLEASTGLAAQPDINQQGMSRSNVPSEFTSSQQGFCRGPCAGARLPLPSRDPCPYPTMHRR